MATDALRAHAPARSHRATSGSGSMTSRILAARSCEAAMNVRRVRGRAVALELVGRQAVRLVREPKSGTASSSSATIAGSTGSSMRGRTSMPDPFGWRCQSGGIVMTMSPPISCDHGGGCGTRRQEPGAVAALAIDRVRALEDGDARPLDPTRREKDTVTAVDDLQPVLEPADHQRADRWMASTSRPTPNGARARARRPRRPRARRRPSCSRWR